jgi:hypothetical protein
VLVTEQSHYEGDRHVRHKIGLGISLAAAGLLVASPALAATGWTVVSAPPAGQNAFLTGVSAASSSAAWAVGSENAETNGVGAKPVIDHWNGAVRDAWRRGHLGGRLQRDQRLV